MSLESDLAKVTENWSESFVDRTFDANSWDANRERKVFQAHGYEVMSDQVWRDGDNHINVGRTATKAVLTGGLGLIISGRSRNSGHKYRTIKYQLPVELQLRREAAAEAANAEHLRRLAGSVAHYRNAERAGLQVSVDKFVALPGIRHRAFRVSGRLRNTGEQSHDEVELEVTLLRNGLPVSVERALVPVLDPPK